MSVSDSVSVTVTVTIMCLLAQHGCLAVPTLHDAFVPYGMIWLTGCGMCAEESMVVMVDCNIYIFL